MNKFISLVPILFFCICVSFVFAQPESPVIRQALVDLFNSTQGSKHWIRQKYWATDAPYCSWENIVCKGPSFTLDLRANDLIGTIPASIGDIGESITSLLMDENRLNGTIPSSLTNLTNLIQLDVSQNELTGSIPTGFGNMTKLQLFWFSDNLLVGAIPVDLQNLLPQVVKFQSDQGCRLAGNQFCCPVPGWVPPECGMGCNVTEMCTESSLSPISIN